MINTQIVFYIFIVIIALYIPVSLVIRQIQKNRVVNYDNTGHPAQAFRELSAEEVSWLRLQISNNLINRPKFLKISLILIIATGLLFFIGHNLSDQYALVVEIPLICSFLLLFIFLMGFFLTFQNINFEKDLSEKVFQVQGKAFKEIPSQRRSHFDNPLYLITIHQTEFSFVKSDLDLFNFYNSIQQGDEVSIEYSPNSKHVWMTAKIIPSQFSVPNTPANGTKTAF